MNNLSNDFVTVDMRGLKASLFERARSERVSASVVVRRAVARELKTDVPNLPGPRGLSVPKSTKVSIRLTASEARVLAARANADGVSMGTLLAKFTAEVPALRSSGTRVDVLVALVASSAELSTLNRNLHHLTLLLRQGSVQAAREYRATLETLADEVRAHLRLASSALADVRPRRAAASAVDRCNP